MELYFTNGSPRLIAEVQDECEAMREINKFLNARDYKSYYTRTWVTPDGSTWFDVGSWSEFFILRP